MLFEDVKTALRIRSDAYNNEVQNLIDAALANMRLVGIHIPTNYAHPPDSEESAEGVPKFNDPLIDRAVILYAKANFGFFEDGDRYQKAYEHLRCSLSLAGDYDAVD